MRDYLRPHWLLLHRALLLHHLVPFLHGLLRFLQEPAIRLAFEQLVYLRERAGTVTNESNINWISQSNALRIEVDLNGFHFSRFGIELYVREGGADYQQSVAVLQDFLRRPRT